MKVSIECTTEGCFDHVLPDEERIKKFEASMADNFKRVAERWKAESVKNAPRGPKATTLKSLFKAGGSLVKLK